MESQDRYTFSNHATTPAAITRVVALLLRNWDNTSDTQHTYLSAFTPTATLDLPPQKPTGHDPIRAARNAMIHPVNGPIVGVQHRFGRVYVMSGHDATATTGGGEVNVAVTGTVKYILKGGREVDNEFATTFDLVPSKEEGEEGEYRICWAKIYMDGSALVGAMGEEGLVPGSGS